MTWTSDHRDACLAWGRFALSLGLSLIGVHSVREDGRCTCGDRDCRNVGKHPLIGGWQLPEQQIRDEAGLLRLLDAGGSMNLGVATGRASGVVVIDIDVSGEKQGDIHFEHYEAERAEGPLPSTLTVRTGSGGWHLYFATPKNLVIGNTSSTWLTDVDIKADKGFVVWAPSLHVSGTRYRLAEGSPTRLAALPDDLVERWRGHDAVTRQRLRMYKSVGNPTRYASVTLDKWCHDLAVTRPGRRNQKLNDAAFGLGMMLGLDMIGVDEVAHALGSAALRTGLSEGETRATLRSGLISGAEVVGVNTAKAVERQLRRWTG